MLELRRMTVGQLLREAAVKWPENTALEYTDCKWNYKQLDSAVDITASKLISLGIKKGEHIGLWCEAEPNYVITLYALARIGAIGCLLNTSLQKEELKSIIKRTDITRMIIGDGYKQLDYPLILTEIKNETESGMPVYYIGLSGDSKGFDKLDDAKLCPEEMLKTAESSVASNDTAYILYTSGTTSAPKAVMGSHFSRTNSAALQAYDLVATEKDRFCVAMPVFHCFCMSVAVLAPCTVGACMYLPESRRTTALLKGISEAKCTVMSSVPALFHAMLSRSDFPSWDLSSLRAGFIGGSIVSEELFKEINDGFGFTLLSSLGQTEATAGITTASFSDTLHTRATTVGHFMDHVEGRIADINDNSTLETGKTGEICVRGYVVMQGYYNNPEATASAIDKDGWLHTGDLGYLDDDGNVHLAGRLKELIIRGGENISPAEIELALADDKRIAECKAVGVPDRHYGEEVCLFIVPADGVDINEHEIRAFLSRRLADFKLPKYILFTPDLPKTSSGKVRSSELSAIAKEKLDLI